MTIHSEHPFATPEPDRDPVRRLRGRLVAPVTLWTAGVGASRVGLTVSSLLVAEGNPGRILGLLDPESDLAGRIRDGGRFTVTPLEPGQEQLAEAFAGLAPAPGGPFRLAEWHDTDWGPVPAGASTWTGCEVSRPATACGYALLVEGEIAHLVVGESRPGLGHRRGRYTTYE